MLTARQAELLKSLPRNGEFEADSGGIGNPLHWLKHKGLVKDSERWSWRYRLTPAGQAAWDELHKQQETN